MQIRRDDLSSEATRALLRLHLAGMHASSPPGHVFALDVSGLTAPEVTVWSARVGEEVAGIGALKQLGPAHGEVKSMRTHPDHLRKGVGAALLERIIDEARTRGLRRLSLETGRGPAFEAALAMYRKRGFEYGGPFADYEASDFNQFMHLDLNLEVAAIVREVTDADVGRIIELWRAAEVARPWNDPQRDIAFARRDPHSTILVAEQDGGIVATAMVGEDGHRGWVYYVAVEPALKRTGLGRLIMQAAEQWLRDRGVWKLQLLVRGDNQPVIGFYEQLGYRDTGCVCLQKVIEPAE